MRWYDTYRHFTALVFAILLFTATLPAWSKGHLEAADLLYVMPMCIVAFCSLPFLSWWSGTSTYWHFTVSSLWASIAGKLAALVLLAVLVSGAWLVSGLTWFHLSAQGRLIFLLAMIVGCTLWLIGSLVDFMILLIEVRQIKRLPDDLAALAKKRGGWHE
jgi:hypothetical protein